MSCEGCLTSPKGQNELLAKIIKEAKKYAVDNAKTMAVYKEGYEFRYVAVDEAIRNNYPIIQVLSGY